MSTQHYEISAAAQHAANVALRNFDLLPIGRVEPTAKNLATVIDVATQAFRAEAALDAVVKAAPWVRRDELKANLERLRDALRAMETVRMNMPRYRDSAVDETIPEFIKDYRVSAPAAHAARAVLQLFQLVQRAAIRPTENNLAILIDVCTQIFRVERAMDTVLKRISWGTRDGALGSLDDLRQAMRAIEIVRNRMPARDRGMKVTIREKQDIEVKLTRAQLDEAQKFAQQVASARTVGEQQQLLARAGLVGHV